LKRKKIGNIFLKRKKIAKKGRNKDKKKDRKEKHKK